MSDQNIEPREVELVFDDERGPEGRSATGAPRFSQSSTGAERSRRPEGFTASAPFGVDGFDAPNPALVPDAVLRTGRVPSTVLGASLVATAIAGVFAANVSGSFAVPGATSLLTPTSGLLGSAASLTIAALSSPGAMAIVGALWWILRRKGERAAASALFVAMWAAWFFSGALSAVVLGAVPFVLAPIAFPAALAAVSTILLRGRSTAGAVGAGIGGALVVLGEAALLVAAGRATLVGALASVLVGVVGALLGARAWNRWWAPVIGARERFRAMMGAAWSTRAA